jgi:adenosylhomocysteine nucleosidase
MECRRATPEDAESILRFWNDSGASMGATDEVRDVRRVTEDPAAVLLLALIDGTIVGSLLGTFDGWRGNLYRLVVAPEHRRQGIGRRLVRLVEQVFLEWGVKRTTVLIEVDRPWAMEFWSAVGYPRDEHVVRHVGVHSLPVTKSAALCPPLRRPLLVVISADAEWAPIKDVLKPPHMEQSPYGDSFTYPVADEQVVFFHGGWGKIAAAASTDYAISRWQPEVLINLGTCGGIEGRAERGEKLLVTRTVTYDIHEAMGGSADAIRAYTTDIDLTWLDGSFPIQVRHIPLVSGDRDLVPSDVPDLVRRFDAVAGDWESGAIAYVASRRNTRLLIVRAVSDLVNTQGGEAIGNFPLFQNEAARVMQSLLDDLAKLVPYIRTRCQGTAG